MRKILVDQEVALLIAIEENCNKSPSHIKLNGNYCCETCSKLVSKLWVKGGGAVLKNE